MEGWWTLSTKTFDNVPHQRLIKKIESYGIQGDIRKWIEAFLSGRTQIVKVNVAESNVPPPPPTRAEQNSSGKCIRTYLVGYLH